MINYSYLSCYFLYSSLCITAYVMIFFFFIFISIQFSFFLLIYIIFTSFGIKNLTQFINFFYLYVILLYLFYLKCNLILLRI